MNPKKKSFSYAKYGYLFSIPFIIVFLIFTFYPTIYTAVLGFTDSQGLGNINFNFLENPLDNFRVVLANQSFLNALWNTILIWVLNFIPQLGLALLLTAWFTSRRSKLRGVGLFKVVFYMPNIITAASVAILFSALFGHPIGPINSLLQMLGHDPYNFLNNPWASRLILIFIQFWMWYGYTMIILVAGALGISPDLYEAAEIDGATGVQSFFRITLPNLKMVMLFVLVTSLIGGLNVFDVPRLFNWGGPNAATTTVAVFIFNWAFTNRYMYGLAAAASMVLFVIVAVISAGIFFLLRDQDAARERKEQKRLRKLHKTNQNREVQKP
ncbi:MAG: sugar ABC transporter permease [Oscillospiraceae bacterium]|nr:sugar ABC transporter permease [Oscillospiraceae bacterium]